MKRFSLFFLLALCLQWASAANFSSNVVADEGAWCWFADPRALHYENQSGTINATYVGYIDVHGNVKATQYDWLTGKKTDVLVRSYFQPDDHDNPTFIVLPDERVMIFYTRHTDEAKIWYRISKNPGDITALGDEKYLSTSANTTYPSPFILSDDPNHIYLCWRGINWHPTIARLTMPDSNDNCSFDFGPKQIVQSTGARPYAKYQSNGKDKIYLSYTTGHPDNEQPNWLYFNVIDINHGNGPILRDINGTQLGVINNGVFNVNKQDSYATNYPRTVVDNSANIRNWVWQITLDANERPVIAYTHIDNARTSHVYWYARWTGTEWRRTWVQYGGHAFHKNWNTTELCYSGGMAVDPENINDLYLSIPTTNGAYDVNGVYEIWKYTIDDTGAVAGSQQLTSGSAKNNVRPFIIPGSVNANMRLVWMNGDYYYWIVKTDYPLGFPTGVWSDYTWSEPLTTTDPNGDGTATTPFGTSSSLHIAFAMDANNYQGTLFTLSNGLTYTLNASTKYPEITYGGVTYTSQNRLYTSDDWATKSGGTSGDNWPTPLTTWVFSMTYDGQTLTTYRNGFVDQVIEISNMVAGTLDTSTSSATVMASRLLPTVCQSPQSVAESARNLSETAQSYLAQAALDAITLPSPAWTDLVLPTTSLGQDITWTSSRPKIITNNGAMVHPTTDASVTLTATCGSVSRNFVIVAKARDLSHNLRYSHDESIDMTRNTASGFATNTTVTAPQGLLHDLRSYTFILKANASSLTNNPRFYDFGTDPWQGSLFLRANPLSAGIKYNGGTTTMINSGTTLSTNTDYYLAVTYSAASGITKIYINGEENTSGTIDNVEPYVLEQMLPDTRNYIGRTQWWDGAYAGDNVDFKGTIGNFRLYDVCLTQKEICELQGLEYQGKDLPTALENGDFEQPYTVQANSGVVSDRAIYVPTAWTVTRTTPNENDITALKSGDKYFSNFFASYPKSIDSSTQSYWIRQNWGTPTLTLSQEILLPEGSYSLSVQVVQDGMGGSSQVSVMTENGATVTAPAISNSNAWQTVTLDFESDGVNSTTVLLKAIHTSNGSSKLIGFDNVVITKKEILGDINYDDNVDTADLIALVAILLGKDDVEPYLYNHAAADVNGDTVISLSDVTTLMNILRLNQ